MSKLKKGDIVYRIGSIIEISEVEYVSDVFHYDFEGIYRNVRLTPIVGKFCYMSLHLFKNKKCFKSIIDIGDLFYEVYVIGTDFNKVLKKAKKEKIWQE